MLSGRVCRVSWHQIICLSIIIVGFLVVSWHFLLFLVIFLLTLHTSSRADAGFGWRMGGYVIYIWKAFTRRFVLDTSESRKFFTVVKDKATVDAYGYVLQTYSACAYRVVPDGYGVLYGLYICISAWASALLVQTTVGNARASRCGTGNGYRLPRFFISTCNHLQTCWIRGVYRRQDL